VFEPVVGVVHDVGVEAHSGDHQERLASGEGPRVRPHVGDLRKFALRRLRGADSADVDPLKPSGQGHHGEVAERGAERKVEVASQQISRSERKNAQRNVGSGELPGDGAHRPRLGQGAAGARLGVARAASGLMAVLNPFAHLCGQPFAFELLELFGAQIRRSLLAR